MSGLRIAGRSALTTTPRSDLTHDVHADVRGPLGALLLAHLLVVRPHVVLDADHAAGHTLRRHIDSVADRTTASHHAVTIRLAIGYHLTGHPGVESETGEALKNYALIREIVMPAPTRTPEETTHVAKPTTRDSWISAETERKEADYRGLLKMHIDICKGLINRQNAQPYLYIDLYAGPGRLEFEGQAFDGSPLIARDLLQTAPVPYDAVHFEKDPDVAGRLETALATPSAVLWAPDATSMIVNKAFEDGFLGWLAETGHQPDRFGLIYSDPIRDEIPYAILNEAACLLPRVDILSYVSATQYKRRRGQDLKRNGSTELPLLGDHIRAVNKRIALIRKPLGAWQWTFVLWSNWVNMPAWTNHGFHRLDSPEGQQILDRLNLTEREHREKANTPLPFPLSGESAA